MDKCRICLETRKRMFSLDDLNGEMSYIDMLAFIASKKIILDSQVPKKICYICRRKLKEAYNFKILIQRSEMELHENHNMNIINFNNLSDIKIKIEITKPNNDYSDFTNCIEMFKNDEKCILYNDVLIKKVCIDTEKEIKPIPMLDFLKNIKNECDDDYTSEVDMGDHTVANYDTDEYMPCKPIKGKKNKKKIGKGACSKVIDDYGMDDDDEYIPYKPIKKKKILKKHAIGAKDSKRTSFNNSVCIKPVYLKNVRVMYYDKNPKVKKKYNKRTSVKKDICPFCGKLTQTLNMHILIHTGERSHKCEICSKGFFHKKILNYHMRKHTASRNFKCDQCVAAFIDKGSLKSHMTSHSDQKDYICDVCKKEFKRKNALKRHVMTHNFGNKNVKCELCTMSFYNNVGLRHHMRVHTGERPFKCEICSQPYSYKHDFNRHCFKKHGIFLKRRSINVMNEEVLIQERALMKDLLLRAQGIVKDDKPLNPFEGPQGALAFEQAIKALATRQIPVDL